MWHACWKPCYEWYKWSCLTGVACMRTPLGLRPHGTPILTFLVWNYLYLPRACFLTIFDCFVNGLFQTLLEYVYLLWTVTHRLLWWTPSWDLYIFISNVTWYVLSNDLLNLLQIWKEKHSLRWFGPIMFIFPSWAHLAKSTCNEAISASTFRQMASWAMKNYLVPIINSS